MMQNTFPIKVEKIAHDGAAEATHEGKPVRVHGMLLGEEGIVEAHKKHGIWVGVLKELSHASPSRTLPEEIHYLACSPWQVMEYPTQVELKQSLISELFSYYDDAPKCGFTPATKFYGYRTKIEFSFCDRRGEEEIPLSLAFHERGGGARRLPLAEGCALASENMNKVALLLCERLRKEGYTARDLKTLIVRESKSEGKVLAMLFAKKTEIPQFAVDDIPGLSGFIVFHSTEKSPASVPTRKLWGVGEETLHESILGMDIQYSWDSFFQNNVPVFEEALNMMMNALPSHARILELYSGVGTIGLLLAKNAEHVHGVEIIQGAVDSAKENAARAKLSNYVAECIPAEKMDARLFDKKNVLVLDPPRVGLHPKIIEMIRVKLPQTIIYLSCNPETQARDYSLLAEHYRIDRIHGFDFYPQTPHVESLLVLSVR